jgi:hypothetical protein
LAFLGGLDQSDESLLGLVVSIEQQRRALDPGRCIIDAPECDAGDVLLVLEQDGEDLGVRLRESLLDNPSGILVVSRRRL